MNWIALSTDTANSYFSAHHFCKIWLMHSGRSWYSPVGTTRFSNVEVSRLSLVNASAIKQYPGTT